MLSLLGPLGAGKTAFVKGLAQGLGLDPAAVGSPTFVIACEYPLADGRRLAHVDLYRVGSEEELEAAGFLDLLVAGVVLAVEWADRLPEALPGDHLELSIQRDAAAGIEVRRILVRPTGPTARELEARWSRALVEEGIRVSR